jgi:hypothetical protein
MLLLGVYMLPVPGHPRQFQVRSQTRRQRHVHCTVCSSRLVLQHLTFNILPSHAVYSYTGEEVVFAVTMDRNHDLIPPNTCRLVYGPGHKHFGSYGLGSDCSWFVTMGRPSSSDSWGPVADAAAIEAVKEELSMKFKGWSFVERMLEREVAVMIRVSSCFALYRLPITDYQSRASGPPCKEPHIGS